MADPTSPSNQSRWSRMLTPGARLGLIGNLSASLVMRLWTVFLQLATTPITIALLGPDQYGLVAFSFTLSAMLALLQQALSPALSRELARIGRVAGQEQNARDLLRTMEVVAIGAGFVIGGVIVLAAPWIAQHGLAKSELESGTIADSIRLMGIGLMLQWPSMLYGAAFMGLQRQDLSLAVGLVVGTLAPLGAILLLWLVEASARMILGWTALTALVTTLVTGFTLWRIMPSGARPQLRPGLVTAQWRFSTGTLLIGVTSALIVPVPALIIAKYCSLTDLGAYNLATSIAMQVVAMATQPMAATIPPHFTQLIEQGDRAVLSQEYHRWSQRTVAAVLPACAVMIGLAEPLLRVWLGVSSPMVEPVARLLPWIAAGFVFNAFVTPAYCLQLAGGATGLIVRLNLLTVAVYLPAAFVLVPKFGPIAVAVCWVVINVVYYAIYPLRISRLWLPGEQRSWWLYDTGLPTLAVASVMIAVVTIAPVSSHKFVTLTIATAAGLACYAALLVLLPHFARDVRLLLVRLR